jgi:hypothetical protein
LRVFVLTTGRSGSVTFANACRHITNFSVGHESRVRLIGGDRLSYPDDHIEVDNRLSWFLGGLEDLHGPDAFYVHLRRDPERVAASFDRRWQYRSRIGVIEAFAHSIVMHRDDWPEDRRRDLCRFYVDTVTANIEAFLRDKPLRMEVWVEDAARDFREFWKRIGADGDVEAAVAEWNHRYNSSPDPAATPAAG